MALDSLYYAEMPLINCALSYFLQFTLLFFVLLLGKNCLSSGGKEGSRESQTWSCS